MSRRFADELGAVPEPVGRGHAVDAQLRDVACPADPQHGVFVDPLGDVDAVHRSVRVEHRVMRRRRPAVARTVAAGRHRRPLGPPRPRTLSATPAPPTCSHARLAPGAAAVYSRTSGADPLARTDDRARGIPCQLVRPDEQPSSAGRRVDDPDPRRLIGGEHQHVERRAVRLLDAQRRRPGVTRWARPSCAISTGMPASSIRTRVGATGCRGPGQHGDRRRGRPVDPDAAHLESERPPGERAGRDVDGRARQHDRTVRRLDPELRAAVGRTAARAADATR